MALAASSVILVLGHCCLFVYGQSLSDEKDNINGRLLKLELTQATFKLQLEKKLENLDKEMKTEVEERLPGLLKGSLQKLLKRTDMSGILKGAVASEMRKVKRKYKKLQTMYDKSEEKIRTLEEENEKVREKLVWLQEDVEILKQSHDRDKERVEVTPGLETGEATPTPEKGEVTPAAEEGEITPTPEEEEEVSPTAEEVEVTPSAEEAEAEVTPTAEEREVTPTVEKGDAEVTPTAKEGEVTITPKEEVTPIPKEITSNQGEGTPSPNIGETAVTPTQDTAELGGMTRLLYLPWGHTNPQQIYLGNLSSNEYPFELQGYQSVTFRNKTQSLIVTVVEPFDFGNKIFTSDLDSSEERVLLKGQSSQGIAIDEERELIIFSTSRPHRTVSSMHFDGSNVAKVADISKCSYANSVALDTDSRTIYVSATDCLLSVGYDGSDLKIKHRGSNIRAVTIDSSNRVVYFNDETQVKKLSLTDGKVTSVTDLGYVPWNFIYYEQPGSSVMYVSSFRKKKIGKLELHNSMTYVPILEGCTPCHHVTSICLLP